MTMTTNLSREWPYGSYLISKSAFFRTYLQFFFSVVNKLLWMSDISIVYLGIQKFLIFIGINWLKYKLKRNTDNTVSVLQQMNWLLITIWGRDCKFSKSKSLFVILNDSSFFLSVEKVLLRKWFFNCFQRQLGYILKIQSNANLWKTLPPLKRAIRSLRMTSKRFHVNERF